MAVDPAIDQKIEAKRSEISTAQSFQEIQSKPTLTDIPLIILPYVKVDLIACLTKSIDSISSDYLEKVRAHKSHLSMGNDSERWIKQGFEVIKDNSCPFCLRPFDPVPEIVTAYNQYFNEEYNQLLRSLSQLSSTVIGFNLEARILQVDSRITSNLALLGFWERHIPNPPILNSLSEEISDLNSAFEAIKLALRNKASNPIQSIDGAAVEAFQSLIENLNQKLTAYNSEIRNYNTKISALKSSTRQNIPQLESELRRLNAIKLRSDTTISSQCTTLSGQVQSLSTLNTQKTTKQAELDNYSVTVFQGYSLRINQYLQIFAPYLEIRDLSSGYVGQSTSPSVNYALHVHGTEVKQDDSTYPSFKYTLSEGDKNALALSFFLAKLESDSNIQNKVVVFDDPVSSFDLNRKSATINKLVSIASQVKQLFVLTHNIVFAGEFWKNAQQVSLTSQCSKVEFINNTSCIVEYNIDTETLSSVLKDSLLIKNYLTNGCLSDQERRAIARSLRPALESYFHLKFFDLVSNNDWMGDFISKVRNAISTDPFFRLQSSLAELTDINDYSKTFHHRFNTACDNQPITDAELKTYCQRTLKLIQVI
ncbi:MAG: AAA family ATPase [Cytophagales bacterium]|nr:AAA family ATPase [Cytophagales bacterium]MCA6371794.1 AAA family ATPase [Cytophagales bacterium]MCA6377527.1 AAA family ATPase [Cytophagales bacterium]MCA6385724.1 AAA family ATPase [Cytophagales bacterium]